MSCTNCANQKIDTLNKTNITSGFLGGKSSYDWLGDIQDIIETNIVEVRFKNNRKDFYRNINQLNLLYSDIVAVQVQGGFDIGIVSLKGNLALKQFKRKTKGIELDSLNIIYRKANENDLRIYNEGKEFEKRALVLSRELAIELNLEMKISDVEFQGDKKKATFYYIADGRVDFREMIKVLAIKIATKIEMRQIGARQEAAKIGGIGSCGKELCCSTWRNQLPSVTSRAIQAQHLSSSMEKYMGQCGKLKCCLTYELATYIESEADFPKELLELETKKGIAYPYKVDILHKTVWYSFKTKSAVDSPIEIPLERVKEIINLNKRGIKVAELVEIPS